MLRCTVTLPISSAKPPTGSRHVPVTNCRRRIRFSLSISFTTCSTKKRLYEKTILCRKAHKVGFEIYLPEPVDLFAVFSVMSIDGVLLPVTQINLLHPAQHKLKEEMIIRQTKHLKSRVIYNSAVY